MILTPGRHPSAPSAVGARNGSQRVQPSPDRARRSQNLLAGEGLSTRLSPTVTDTLEFPDTEEVTGSNPVRPTPFFENLSSDGSLDGSQRPAVLALRCWSEHLTLRPEWEILSGLTSSAEDLSSYRSGHPVAVHFTERWVCAPLVAPAESECLTSCGSAPVTARA